MMLEDDAGLFDELHSDVLARAILSPRRAPLLSAAAVAAVLGQLVSTKHAFFHFIF